MAKRVGGAKKTETFTTRLEPREKYVLELLARLTGRSIAKTLEAAIQREAGAVPVKVPGRPEISPSLQSLIGVLWHPQEWRRIIFLGGIAPELLTYNEECKLSLVLQSRALSQSVRMSSYGAIISVAVHPRRIELAWPLICDRAQAMADGLPAPPPTLEEIGLGDEEIQFSDEGVTIGFENYHPAERFK